MADLAMFGQTTHDLSLFRLGRLDAGPQRGVEGDDRF
jgi:hypothetical protein